MEENNLPEQMTEDQLETVALDQEEKIKESAEENTGGKKCNKCAFLTVIGLLLLVAMLALYVWNLYKLQLSNEMQRILDNMEVTVPDTTEKVEKTDAEKTDGELLDELSDEVEDDFDNLEMEIDQMDTEVQELETAPLSE